MSQDAQKRVPPTATSLAFAKANRHLDESSSLQKLRQHLRSTFQRVHNKARHEAQQRFRFHVARGERIREERNAIDRKSRTQSHRLDLLDVEKKDMPD